jgi:hypothetical protein
VSFPVAGLASFGLTCGICLVKIFLVRRPVGVQGRLLLEVLEDPSATLLVGLSTVLAVRSWTQGFEFSLSAVLADWDSADEVGVCSVSDLVLGGFLAWLAEGGAARAVGTAGLEIAESPRCP